MATALPLVLVRTLAQSEFGVYKQAFLLVSTALGVLPLGFGMSAFYFLPRDRTNHQAVVLHILGVHLAVGGAAAAVLVAWPGVLVLIFRSADLVPYASLLAAVVVTWTVGSFLDIVAVARQDLVASTLFIVGSQATKTFVFIVAAWSGGSIGALLAAAMVQGVIQILALLWYLQWRFPGFWTSFDWPMLRTQASYALPLGLSSLVFKFQNDLPQYFVANAFGPSLYAIFAVGVFNVPLVGLMRESVGSVMLPRVSRLEQEEDSRAILLLVARVARKLALVYFPLYVFLLVVGREFIVLLFTRQYASSWPVFAVYLTVIPLGVIVLDPITRAYAEQRYFLLKLRVVLFLAMTVTFVVGIHRLGLLGTISVVVIVQLAGTIGAAWRLTHVMHVRRSDFAAFVVLIRIGAAAVAAGALAMVVRHALIARSPFAIVSSVGVAYAVAYVLALGAARVVEADDVAAMRAIFGRGRSSRTSAVTGTLLAEAAEQ
jgi:O-antigen/teichoic acid export membrane protein